ncbi:Alpha/Beta hydrolase protein [Obelidium mucronatum]|nr:Alpha/Beta hydrolase protein [Obelidium mucronatum]
MILEIVVSLYVIAFFVYFITNADLAPGLPLHPVRVVKVNIAFAGHIVGMLIGPVIATYSRFLIRRPSFTKGIVYAERNGEVRKLDLHHPIRGAKNQVKMPVVVFIYGGAWCSGSKDIYAPLAQSLLSAGYVVVVPNYVLYPKGKVEDMLDDIADALVWTHNHVSQYGGDPSNIHIMGHSAGAHLAALVLVHNFNSQTNGEFCVHPTDRDSEMRPLVVALPRIRSATLLAGVYNIHDHYLYEAQRGCENISAMARCMGVTRDCLDARSPDVLLRNINCFDIGADSLARRNAALVGYLPSDWLIIHGDNDTTVPIHQSVDFYNVLHNELCIGNSKLKVYPRVDHGTPILVPMSLDSDYTQDFLQELHSLMKQRN